MGWSLKTLRGLVNGPSCLQSSAALSLFEDARRIVVCLSETARNCQAASLK